MSFRTKARRLLLGTLAVYALLVATHLGEFWPFSIYPMFSQGGNAWSRAIVRDVSAARAGGEGVRWQPVERAGRLPGEPFPLLRYGIDPIDLANFVSKTKTWDADRLGGLRTMFHDHVGQRDLLVMRVNGRLTEGDSVVVEYVPYVLLRADSTAANPRLVAARW